MRFLIRNAERLVLLGIIAFLLFLVTGSSATFAKSGHDLNIPFVGAAIALVEAPAVQLDLVREVREVSATYEHYIVSTALQSMRVLDGVKEVPSVTVATNDMENFPSSEQSLYPDYLTKRFSQFRYTVSSDGVVSVDASVAKTEVQLDRIEQWLDQLEE
ncbi:hypothetical protein ACFLXJ_04205 [Chloroflexota bacterium]